jgi:hypothetical protein
MEKLQDFEYEALNLDLKWPARMLGFNPVY